MHDILNGIHIQEGMRNRDQTRIIKNNNGSYFGKITKNKEDMVMPANMEIPIHSLNISCIHESTNIKTNRDT